MRGRLVPASMIVPAWRRLTEGESTWPVRAAVLAATALQVAIPNRYEIPPTWLLPTLGILLGIGFSIPPPGPTTPHTPRFGLITIMLIGVISLATAVSGGLLIGALLRGTANE